MENIVIPVKGKAESKFLMELATKLGYSPFSLSEKNDTQFYKSMFANLVKATPKKAKGKISLKEVQKEIDEVRTKNHAAKKK